MSCLTVTYFYWYLIDNECMRVQFLRERELHVTKNAENSTE